MFTKKYNIKSEKEEVLWKHDYTLMKVRWWKVKIKAKFKFCLF